MKPGLKQTLCQAPLILVIAVVAAGLTKWLHPQAPNWYQVSEMGADRYQVTVEELRERYLPDQLLWIDARRQEDFAAGHLNGAHPLSEDNWAEYLWALRTELDTLDGRAVVVYCDGKTCKRSAAVGKRLRSELGIEPVWVLSGDWRDW